MQTKIKNPVTGTFLICCSGLLLWVGPLNAQNNSNQALKAQLNAYYKQSIELMNTNKNAPALEVLQRYGQLQESIIVSEKDSNVAAINAAFNQNRSKRLSEIATKEQTIATLKTENDDIDAENRKMTRNTLMFFGVLTGLAVLILLNRFRKLAVLKELLELSNSRISKIESIISESRSAGNSAKSLFQQHTKINEQFTIAGAYLTRVGNDKQNELNKPLQMAVAGNTKILSFFNPETVEETGKQSTNLNALIDEVTDQAYHSKVLEYPDFNCTVQKDLEKILPNVELEPVQIKSVIFSILSNAFDAIREKRSNAPKGYDPKVTITTRKLPRFVQVRIKDNGTGISFKDPKVIFEPFFTTKNGAQHAGLGLSEAYRIMTVVHKGELLVESDSGQGTDIIIRFPIATIM